MLAFVFKIYLQKQQGWLQFLDCLYPVNHRGQRQDELHTHSYSVSCQNASRQNTSEELAHNSV